mgnify:CR=1 FL=1
MVKCNFGNLKHILIFNENYSDFISIRESDSQIITNNPNIIDEDDIDISYFTDLLKYYKSNKVKNTELIKYVMNNINPVLNKKFQWGTSTIIFLKDGKMNAFGSGKYHFIGNYLIKCVFGGREHLLKFDENYQEYISLRKDDFEVIKGNIL